MRAGGVLGRLARFLAQWLRGLAWRLDHAAGGTAVPQPVLAALAERFPGAPEHWLADIARQMIATGEPLPGVEISALPMESPPAIRPAPPAPTFAGPPSSTRSARASSPPPVRRTRPALRLIGGGERRQPATEMASQAAKRRPAMLRWLAASPKTAAQPTYPDTSVSQRRQPEFAIDTRGAEPSSPGVPFEFRKAERVTTIPSAPDRVGLETPQPSAIRPLARRTFLAASEGRSREQETGFAMPLPPAVADLPATSVFPDPGRTPVEFAPLRAAQRVSLSFPQAHPQRGPAEWASLASSCWPALPPHEQTIADAPAHASPLTDLTREQMAGQWSA